MMTATALPAQPYSTAVDTNTEPISIALPYFEVTLGKFVVMSLVSFGLYELYWVYQQWKRVKAQTMDDLSPFWRTFFAPLWVFGLFEHIRVDGIRRHVPIGWGSGSLTLAYVVLNIVWRLPDPWWLMALFSFLPIIPPVRAIVAIHDTVAANRDRNARFSAANIAGIVFGGIFTLLVVVASFST